MSLPGIETLGGQPVEPLSGQRVRSEVVEQFREVVEQIVQRLSAKHALDTRAPARTAVPGPSGSAAVATQSMLPAPATHGLSANGSSTPNDPNLMPLDLLPADLVAGDAQYNAREVILRERLDPLALERRLRESATAAGVEFDQSDLEGVFRNAGYDGAHLGSGERYTAAIETFMGEAERTYQLRTSNVPGSNA